MLRQFNKFIIKSSNIKQINNNIFKYMTILQNDNFKSDEKYDDFNKNYVNIMISKYIKKYKLYDNTIILDGANTMTSNTVLKYTQIDKNNIYIANYNKKTYDEIKKNGFNVYNGLLYDFLLTTNINNCSLAYFDYCCTFTGNKKQNMMPKKDIELYFDKKIPKNNSLFVVTFSWRDKNIDKIKSLTNKINNISEYIKICANKNNYNIAQIDETHIYFTKYHKPTSMFTIFYKTS